MPIGDLLASITGEKPTPSSVSAQKAPSSAPKRKADDDLKGLAPKAPRTNGTSAAGSESLRPQVRPSDKAPSTLNGKVSSWPRPAERTAATPLKKPSPAPLKSAGSNGAKPSPAGAAISKQRAPNSSAPPKKRSFAEIMARASAQQETRAALGKIHHKTVERGITMKERKELKADEARKPKKDARRLDGRDGGSSRNGSGKPGAGLQSSRDDKSRTEKTAGSRGKRGPVVEEKKVKKAALATTGYVGTARPHPDRPNGASARSGSGLGDRSRYGGYGSRRRNDDYDEDLDDFIEYDDEEEEPGYGRRGGYDSVDDESDMEAGLSDIDQEERRADYYARREDDEQEALEKEHRRQKEERKRRLASGR